MIEDRSREAFVYLWFDGKNRKFYVGKHLGRPTDSYAHASTRMENFTMRTKPPYMRRRILAFGTHDEMVELEHSILKRRKHLFGIKYYNGSVAFPTALPGVDHHFYKHGKYCNALPPEERKANEAAAFKKWYEENKEHKNNYSRKWQAENPEYMKNWYLEHKEELNKNKRMAYAEKKLAATGLPVGPAHRPLGSKDKKPRRKRTTVNKTATLEILFG